MFGAQKKSKGGGDAPGRRTTRARKVSQRMAVVDEGTRQQATQARLDALENDNNDVQDAFGLADSDDEEFMAAESDDSEPGFGRKSKKRKAVAKRKTRADKHGPKNFTRLLEEANLEAAPPGVPTYLTAAAGPSTATAPRKFCSVCGFMSTYTCSRCGSKYCSRKCYIVHTDTRCLKFVG